MIHFFERNSQNLEISGDYEIWYQNTILYVNRSLNKNVGKHFTYTSSFQRQIA
jgi:hypothetical protein